MIPVNSYERGLQPIQAAAEWLLFSNNVDIRVAADDRRLEGFPAAEIVYLRRLR